MSAVPSCPRETTSFLPVGRADLVTLRHLARRVGTNPLLTQLLESCTGPACVLNPQRQVIGVNRALLFAVGVPDLEAALGQRPGELFECMYAREGPDGCGTTPHCATCGAARAIQIATSRNVVARRECHISVAREGRPPLDLEATATPVVCDGTRLVLLSFRVLTADTPT